MNSFNLNKTLYFLSGVCIAAFTYPFGYQISLIALLLSAVLKEVWDLLIAKEELNLLDFIIVTLGGMFLIVWYNLIDFYRVIDYYGFLK